MLLLSIGIMLAFFALLDIAIKNRTKKIILFIFVLSMSILAGIRWNTGTDWTSYYLMFQISTTYNEAIEYGGVEWGFMIFNYIIHQTFNNYSVFLFLFAFIKLYLKNKVISHKDFIKYGFMSFFMYYCYTVDMISTRQGLAASITLLSIFFIFKRNFLGFFITILIASLFHRTSLVFLLAYPVYFLNLSKKQLLVIFLTGFGLGILFRNTGIGSLSIISSILNHPLLSSFQDRFDGYIEEGVDLEYVAIDPKLLYILGQIKKILIIFPILYFYKMDNRKISGMLNIIVLGTLLYNILGAFSVVFLRFSGYFDIFEIFVLPYVIYGIRDKFSRYTILLLYIIMFLLRLYTSLSSVWDLMDPYLTIFDSNNYRDTY